MNIKDLVRALSSYDPEMEVAIRVVSSDTEHEEDFDFDDSEDADQFVVEFGTLYLVVVQGE